MQIEKIKVLHIVSELSEGGTQKVMQSFVNNLNKDIFTPAVFANKDGKRGKLLRDKKIPTFIGPDVLSILDKFSPDIVHIHRAGWTTPGTLRPFKLAKTPVVVETNIFGHYDPSPEGKIIDKHLFVSQFCLNRFLAVNKINPNPQKYDFLYNPVDTNFFEKKCTKDRNRPTNNVGRISRADKGKWSNLAYDFLPLILQKLDPANFKYRVIGAIDEFSNYIAQHNLSSYVETLDPILTDNELADFLNSISVLVHANDTGESFGLVIAEAMAAGLPVVTHPSKGLRDNAQLELVDDGITGIVAKTSEEFANAIAYLLKNPDIAIKMGEQGRKKAKSLYNDKLIINKLEKIYLELLKQKNK